MEGEIEVSHNKQELDTNLSFGNSNDFGAVQLQQPESEQQQQPENSFVDAEWDPVQFNLNKSSNPRWSGQGTRSKQPPKPRRIQDICLQRLDSEDSLSSSGRKTPEQEIKEDGGVFDNWPYEEGSPCALFGKVKMTSSPSKEFDETGEFSRGDPEWENGSRGSRRSGRSSESREKVRRRRRQQQEKEKEEEQEEDDENDEESASLGSIGNLEEGDDDDDGSQSGGSDEYSESERSLTESPNHDDDDLMVTPAMGKAKEQRKKPPTLKRGAHGVQTPSVVKALKGKQAFGSDDEGDNDNIDFDEFDSDADSAASGSRKNRDNGSSRPKRDGRLDAANASFRRASLSRRGSKKFNFDRSMSSADLKAARKANNSFKGQMEMNKSFSAIESKRRAQRKQKDMQGSFSGSSNSKKSSRSPIPVEQARSSRKMPIRAKSLGNPTGGGNKLKSALSKFAGPSEATAAPETKPKASGKNYGATLSALKALSGSDAGDKGGDKEADLKAAIMQQVFRSTSLNPVEIKRKPKPKIQKSLSLSASGLARVAAANGEIPEGKQAPARVRRAKTSMDRAQASSSDFNHSYHESMAKMRRHKMADASERSAQSALSAASAASAASQSSKASDSSKETKQRPPNLDRKVKSFSHARSGTSLVETDEEDEAPVSPEQKPSRPRLKRGSSKRLQSPGGTSSSDLDSKGSSSHSPRRKGLQKSGSRRRIRPEYDANPQTPDGTNIIALLKTQEPVAENELMQKGNRQMFHALMFKTRMGIDMEKLRRKVEGIDDDEEDEEEDTKPDDAYESEGSD